MGSAELAAKFREMAERERSYAEELKRLASRVKHPVLQALFEAIAMDSEKHAVIYAAAARLVEQPQPMISEEELEAIRESVRKHIETEAEMIRFTEQLVETLKDLRTRLLLAAINEDERRHHRLLKAIEKDIAEAETLKEELVWEMVWRDAIWHGAPGG